MGQASSATPPPGPVGVGTAHITMGDKDLGLTEKVRCRIIPPLRMIDTGDATSGTTTVVSTAGLLAVESVQIRNLAGFTGSYTAGLAGHATAKMVDNIYTITGDADGFAADNASFVANRSFSITVAC